MEFSRLLVRLRKSSKLLLANTVEQPFMELPQGFCCGVCNLLNCKNVFIYMKPSK